MTRQGIFDEHYLERIIALRMSVLAKISVFHYN